jgi:hypothetical protein
VGFAPPQTFAHAALNVVRAVSRFPHTSHVQHPIYFGNIKMYQLQHKKKTDETLETSV